MANTLVNVLRISFLAALVIGLAACRTGSPIYNVAGAQVTDAKGNKLSMNQISKAIRTAALERGWQPREIKPGHIVATISVRKHSAVVDIKYSRSKYDITYKSSKNLRAEGNKIHPNYNSWVQNLNNSIQTNLLAI